MQFESARRAREKTERHSRAAQCVAGNVGGASRDYRLNGHVMT